MALPLLALAVPAGLLALYIRERETKKDGPMPAPATQIPPVPLMPGAEAYLPPIQAPEQIRNLIANALYSQNPIALRTTSKNLEALGYGSLTASLLARATQLDAERTQSAAAGMAGPFVGYETAAVGAWGFGGWRRGLPGRHIRRAAAPRWMSPAPARPQPRPQPQPFNPWGHHAQRRLAAIQRARRMMRWGY